MLSSLIDSFRREFIRKHKNEMSTASKRVEGVNVRGKSRANLSRRNVLPDDSDVYIRYAVFIVCVVTGKGKDLQWCVKCLESPTNVAFLTSIVVIAIKL